MGFYEDGADRDFADVKKVVEGELKNIFPSEFQGRIDETVIFSRLCEQDMIKIAEIFIDSLRLRAAESGTQLSSDPSVAQLLARSCDSRVHGARNLRNLIVSEIENPLAALMLSDSAPEKVRCFVRDGKIVVGHGGECGSPH